MISRYLSDQVLNFAIERLRDAKWDLSQRVDFMMATNGKKDFIDSLEVTRVKDEANPNCLVVRGVQVPLIGKTAEFRSKIRESRAPELLKKMFLRYDWKN